MDAADTSSRTGWGPMESPAAIRVVIADDHTIFRKGLRSVLEAEAGFIVVGEAADGDQAVELCRSLEPHVLLLDLVMPGSRGWTRWRSWRRHPLRCGRSCSPRASKRPRS